MILYGHRGAKGEAPENTLAGFQYAQALGIDAFELDVRLSADQQLVLMHDPTVDRTTDGRGPVSAFDAAELSRLDARAQHPGWPTRVGVPTLAGLFAALPDAAQWEVEIKTDAPDRMQRICRELALMVEQYGLRGRVTVSSFDPTALELISAAAADLPRCFIAAFDTPGCLETALRLGCAQVAVPLRTGSAEIVRAARSAGLRVAGWPGNTPEDIRTLRGWGVDQITTDFPTMALEAVRGVGDDRAPS